MEFPLKQKISARRWVWLVRPDPFLCKVIVLKSRRNWIDGNAAYLKQDKRGIDWQHLLAVFLIQWVLAPSSKSERRWERMGRSALILHKCCQMMDGNLFSLLPQGPSHLHMYLALCPFVAINHIIGSLVLLMCSWASAQFQCYLTIIRLFIMSRIEAS